MFIFYMACKSQTRKENGDQDEGFEDLSSSALHEIHYGHINQGFEEEPPRDEDELDPVSNKKSRFLYNRSCKKTRCIMSR